MRQTIRAFQPNPFYLKSEWRATVYVLEMTHKYIDPILMEIQQRRPLIWMDLKFLHQSFQKRQTTNKKKKGELKIGDQ